MYRKGKLAKLDSSPPPATIPAISPAASPAASPVASPVASPAASPTASPVVGPAANIPSSPPRFRLSGDRIDDNGLDSMFSLRGSTRYPTIGTRETQEQLASSASANPRRYGRGRGGASAAANPSSARSRGKRRATEEEVAQPPAKKPKTAAKGKKPKLTSSEYVSVSNQEQDTIE